MVFVLQADQPLSCELLKLILLDRLTPSFENRGYLTLVSLVFASTTAQRYSSYGFSKQQRVCRNKKNTIPEDITLN